MSQLNEQIGIECDVSQHNEMAFERALRNVEAMAGNDPDTRSVLTAIRILATGDLGTLQAHLETISDEALADFLDLDPENIAEERGCLS